MFHKNISSGDHIFRWKILSLKGVTSILLCRSISRVVARVIQAFKWLSGAHTLRPKINVLLVLRWLILGDKKWRILSCVISPRSVLFVGVCCSPHLTIAVRELCSWNQLLKYISQDRVPSSGVDFQSVIFCWAPSYREALGSVVDQDEWVWRLVSSVGGGIDCIPTACRLLLRWGWRGISIEVGCRRICCRVILFLIDMASVGGGCWTLCSLWGTGPFACVVFGRSGS